jgi:hypothetical protein
MTDPGSDREMLVLERARKGLAPSAAQRKATLGRLAAALALAPTGVPSPSTSSAPPPHAGSVAGLKTGAAFSLRALVTGVLGGALAGFGVGHFVAPQQAEQAAPQAQSALTSTDMRKPSVQMPDVPVLRPLLLPSGSVSPSPTASGEVPPLNSPGSQRERSRRESRRQGNAESANDDELSYVQRAQTALRSGDAVLALGLMRSLDELQPRGALAAERTVISVLALCQLGRTAEARSIAAAAVKSGNAPEVYRRRLESSCVGQMGESLE